MEEEKHMDKELYEAVVEGNEEMITRNVGGEDYLMRKTPQKNNIIHLSVQHEQLKFTKAAVRRFPELICETNCEGNNTLHVAAEMGNLGIVELLVGSYKEVSEVKEMKEINIRPWRVKNEEGNTPLHVALIHGNVKIACYLLELDSALARFVNNFKETPLHLAVHHRVNEDRKLVGAAMRLVANKRRTGFITTGYRIEKDSMPVVELLLQKDRSVACCTDIKGLTPLLTGAVLNPPFIPAIEAILHCCPESAEVCDPFGNSFLHLMDNLFSYGDAGNLLRFSATRALRNKQNKQGNTPAHIAVMNHNIGMILLLLKSSANLAIKNKQGFSTADLIQRQSKDFQNLLETQAKEMLSPYGEVGPQLSDNEVEEIKNIDLSCAKKAIEKFRSFFHKKSQSGNILHIILKWLKKNHNKIRVNEFLEFITQGLEIMPSLICESDDKGHNPFHLLVLAVPDLINIQLLNTIEHYFHIVQQEAPIDEFCYDPPWKAKDINGNTPLHLALYEYQPNYIRCARTILQFKPELADEENGEGEVPLHQLTRVYLTLSKFNMPDELFDDVQFIIQNSRVDINKADRNGLTPLVKAAKEKNFQFLNLLVQQSYDNVGWSPDALPKGNTFWHLLANLQVGEDDEKCFRQASFHACKTLRQVNEDGNTPIHLAIEYENFKLARIFLSLLEGTDLPNADVSDLGNNNGNTPLHLSVGKSRSPYAEEFIKYAYYFPGSVLHRNKEGNIPLHLAILEDDSKFAKIMFDIFHSYGMSVNKILEIGDKDQNTPLHLAIMEGRFELAKLFFNEGEMADCIDEILCRPDKGGNTPLHLVALKGEPAIAIATDFIARATRKKCIYRVLKNQNNNGDTPLHLAIKKRNFQVAMIFINGAITTSCIEKVLEIPNKKDETLADAIGSAKYLTNEFEKFFWKEPQVVQAMLGVRSLSGIPTDMIKEYTNTIGVTAALLATITFTAAFTVPGGLNSNDGTPLLISRAPFQLFMVSDILALCLSMMVLFCLLWIMTISDNKHQVVLLDITVFLLEAAFYATLFTFMTGLYVTVSSAALWIAILACVLCSLLILLMHKRLIVAILPCLIQIYVLFQKVYSPVRHLCGRILCCCCTSHQQDEEGSSNYGQGQSQTIVNMPSIN